MHIVMEELLDGIERKGLMLKSLIDESEMFQGQMHDILKTLGQQESGAWPMFDNNFDDYYSIKFSMYRKYGHTSMISECIKNIICNNNTSCGTDTNIVVICMNKGMCDHFCTNFGIGLEYYGINDFNIANNTIHFERRKTKVIVASGRGNLDCLRGIDCKYAFIDSASYIKEEIEKIKTILSPIANFRRKAGKTFVCCFLG